MVEVRVVPFGEAGRMFMQDVGSKENRRASSLFGRDFGGKLRQLYSKDGVHEGLVHLPRDASDQLVQSRKQKLQDGRFIRLFIAQDQIDRRRVSLERTTRYRRREEVLCVSR